MTGNAICQPFQKLPDRRRYADYYREIKNPISLIQIRSKLVRADYSNVNELATDLSMMFENAKRYNRPDSKLFKAACKLHKMMQSKVQQISADDDVIIIKNQSTPIHVFNLSLSLPLPPSLPPSLPLAEFRRGGGNDAEEERSTADPPDIHQERWPR